MARFFFKKTQIQKSDFLRKKKLLHFFDKNNNLMDEITLKFNKRNVIAKKTLEYILSIGVFKMVGKSAIDISLEEVKKGRIKRYEDTSELFDKILN